VGAQQGNPAAFVADSLMAQQPLLDEGKGEFEPNSVSMNIDTHTEQEILQMRETISSHPPQDLPPTVPPAMDASTFSSLEPPRLDSTGGVVTGADTPKHRIENKQRRQATLANQAVESHWTIYKGEFELPDQPTPFAEHRGEMCPSGLALCHPTADLLREWATYGCPTNTGTPWTAEQMQAAVDRGPHRLALSDEAIAHFRAEVDKKVKSGQAKLVAWDSIKDNPPAELKISPIVAIPHILKQFRLILDLSFNLKLKQGSIVPSVNSTTVKTAPKGAIDQLGHSLTHIIHAFAEAEEDARIFMAKWDIKDGFWRLDAEEGAKWNFSYVLPQHPGEPIYLVVPTSLQMGWVESPPFFCAALETARDVAQDYCETKLGTLPPHKFTNYVIGNQDYEDLP